MLSMVAVLLRVAWRGVSGIVARVVDQRAGQLASTDSSSTPPEHP
jgi:hypothetical protein